MYSALNMRGEIHTYGRLLHFLVLGTQNLPDSTMPKQASINAFKLCHAMLIWGDFGRTLPAHNPQRESLRLQNYKKFLIYTTFKLTFFKINAIFSRILIKLKMWLVVIKYRFLQKNAEKFAYVKKK